VISDDGETLFRVNIPTPDGVEPPSAPTGQVFNRISSDFKGDAFIFVTENGTVAGWHSGFEAVLRFTAKDEAIYKGVAIAETHRGRHLLAADFHNNKIDVFDDHYKLLDRQHDFFDDLIPCDFAPFNVFVHKNLVFVTYAKQDVNKEDDVKGPGNGFVE